MIKEQQKKIGTGIVRKLDTLDNQAKSIYLGIGSNLGNKKRNIEIAKFKLSVEKIYIIKSSCFYESLSWPNPKNPKFLNIVLKIKTDLNPIELLKICKKIEIELGRKKSKKNAPRQCDIDIIDFKNLRENKQIVLPHPRLQTRNFVLFPLFELDKNWKHPISKLHIKTLIYLLSNRDIRTIKQI